MSSVVSTRATQRGWVIALMSARTAGVVPAGLAAGQGRGERPDEVQPGAGQVGEVGGTALAGVEHHRRPRPGGAVTSVVAAAGEQGCVAGAEPDQPQVVSFSHRHPGHLDLLGQVINITKERPSGRHYPPRPPPDPRLRTGLIIP